MRYYKFYFIAASLIISFNNIVAQKKLSLDEAITIALNRNTNAVKSENNLKSTEASLKTAYGDFLPTLNVNTGWGWQRVSDDGGKTQIDYFGNAQVIGPSQTDSRSFSFGMNGNVTLFDGLANILTVNQRKNNLAAARFDLDKLKQDIILQTINYYVAIVNGEKLLKFQEEDLKYNNSMLDKIKEMFDLKMITISDVYSQEVQAANSELVYLQTKNNYEKSKISLLNYLSMDVAENYSFELNGTKLLDTLDIDRDLDNLYKEAIASRNDYQSQILKLKSSQYQLSISKGDLLPQLNGNYGFSTNAIQPGDLFSRRVYSVGLSLSLPIFSHWSTDYSIQLAKVQIENSQEDLSALERQIKSEVKNSILDLQTAKKQLDVSDKAVKSAEANWIIKKEAYTLGSATYIDLQQIYRDYLQAQNNKINQEQNYLIKQFTLKNALGKLTTN
ncbi:MAG: TolC family protein [Ignavibacteriales bacterium]|nr:TolC family protein [Ignavibacteriales bacterium]